GRHPVLPGCRFRPPPRVVETEAADGPPPHDQERHMAEYAILIYGDESQFEQTPEAWAAMMDAHGAFAKAVAEAGVTSTGGNALQSAGTATAIRGGSVVTDGPFVETKETLGGFYLVDCKD